MGANNLLSLSCLTLVGLCCVGCSSDSVVTSPPVSSAELTLISAEPVIPFSEPDFFELTFVDRAYALIGIKRARFDPTNSSVQPSHREYVKQCLAVMDQAVVWRVSGLQAIANDNFSHADWNKAGDNLVASLNSLNVPPGLESHAQSITECLLAYGRFFARHAEGGSGLLGQDWQSDRDLRISSNAVRTAYQDLIKLHWQADAHVQTAYYNTHMALDPF